MPSAYKLLRATDGKLRIDYGDMSVISDPVAKLTIALDHLKQEARVIPMPPGIPQMPVQLPGMPQPPALPGIPANIEELGTRVIDGYEAIGKRYTFQPPAIPAIPQIPPRPNIPQILEVWTSPKLHLSILTKMTGSFGAHTNTCKIAVTSEPPAAMFQIPPGYKMVETPTAPKLPSLG
jgi:hypothetical protein